MNDNAKNSKNYLKKTRTTQIVTGISSERDRLQEIADEQPPELMSPIVNLNVFSDSFDDYYFDNHAGNFKHPIAIPELYIPNHQIALAGFTIPYDGWDNLEYNDWVSWYDKVDEHNFKLVGSAQVKRGNYNLRELIDAVNLAVISVYERKIATCEHFDFNAVPFLKLDQGYVKLQPGSYFDGQSKKFVESIIQLGPLLSELVNCSLDGMCEQTIHSNQQYKLKENVVDIEYPYSKLILHSNLCKEPLLEIPVDRLREKNGKPSPVEQLKWLPLDAFTGNWKFRGPPEFWIVTDKSNTHENHAIHNNKKNKISFRLRFRKLSF